ncbi:MAG TPA: DUF1223 domain-containing protein, partial [Thermoanaerobaculia bacterium]|nr:DUF1223 domain-containing protein [Thermoanaerobaculia bacterium]
MNLSRILLSGALALVLAPVFLASLHSAQAAPEDKAAAPVIVELFTSQGCSSCPPADRLLTRLGGDPGLAGRVIPLAFHVDYWNHIGWTDPFSAKRWSERQQAYARAFKANRIYTPQLVVNGRTEGVGSHEPRVRKQIADALAREPAGRVSLGVETPAAGQVRVKVGARLARQARQETAGDLDAWVAVVE